MTGWASCYLLVRYLDDAINRSLGAEVSTSTS